MSVDAVLSRIEATCRKAKAAVDADREPEPPRHRTEWYLPMGVRGLNRGHRRWTKVVVER